jgi:hypothetical protein
MDSPDPSDVVAYDENLGKNTIGGPRPLTAPSAHPMITRRTAAGVCDGGSQLPGFGASPVNGRLNNSG